MNPFRWFGLMWCKTEKKTSEKKVIEKDTIDSALREVYGDDITIDWYANRFGLSVAISFVDGLKLRKKYRAKIQYYGDSYHHLLNSIGLVYFRMKEKVIAEYGRIDDR